MSRISSLAANVTLINQMLRTQERLFNLETQVSSQKKAQEYEGIAVDSQRLLNLENTKTQLERFIKNNTQQEVRTDIQSTVVEGIRDAIKSFKSSLEKYDVANRKDSEQVQEVQSAAFRGLRSIQNLLNTDVAGRFIFSGSRVEAEPVEFGISSVASFQSTFDGFNVTVPTTRDAHLERFSFSEDDTNVAKQHIDPANFLIFAQDNDGVTTTGGNSSITATSPLFANVAAGSTIVVSGTASNNGTYTVSSVSNSNRTIEIVTTMLTDELNVTGSSVAYADPTKPLTDLTKTDADYGNLTFNRAANTIVAATANGLNGIPVGARITVAGTTNNNAEYTVLSNNGTTITVDSNKLTDEGLGSGNAFFDMYAGTRAVFTPNAGTNDDTIQIQQFGGGGSTTNVFKGLAPGDTVTFTNTLTNNATYTINTISADGSTITVDETVTLETDTAANISGSNGFAYTIGTQLDFNAATETIELQDSGGTAVAGAFSNLQVGQSFAVTGTASNNGTFTIASIAANGSSVTVTQDITVNETDNTGARIQSFAAAGTIKSTPYYSGDSVSLTHRVSDLRSFENDINAADPAFEKAIRAMKLIMQGEYGSSGGLDENLERVGQARYLLESSLEITVSGTAPFGTELTSNIQIVQQNIGFNQVLLDSQNKFHKDFIGFIEGSISDIENVDQLSSITKLLDESRALEASYQTFSRIRQLSLTNFL